MLNISYTLDELKKHCQHLWQITEAYKIVLLHGEMGVGKTTLVKTLCEFKNSHSIITSPTFSIVNEYVYTENNIAKKIYHLDLYRLKSEDESFEIGITEILESNEIVFIEWPALGNRFLPLQKIAHFNLSLDLLSLRRTLKIEIA